MMEKDTWCPVIFSLLGMFLVASCSKEDEFPPRDNTDEVRAFYQHHNELIKGEIDRDVLKLQKELANPDLDEKSKKEKQLLLDTLLIRQRKPEVFTFATLDDLPKDLKWIENWDAPEIGSDKAKKGGVFNYFFEGLAYPATLRIIGPESNNSFRGDHWNFVEMGLVGSHPDTGEIIPALADRWAVSEDKRTVYFRIHEKATYNDGVPVESDDFFMAFYMNLSPYVANPWGKQYYKKQFWNITRYDAKTLSITLSNPKPLTPYYANLLPFARHFYKEVGPDFEKRYNWRPHPTTGGYEIRKEDILKGRSITLTRVKNWWAKDMRYSKNRCNVDKIKYHLVRDMEKALQFFKRGKIDFMTLNIPKNWYEKTEFDAVFDGYLEKATFYNDYPAVPRGLYFNCSRPLLNNRDIRIGLQHASNWEKVIQIEHRGDAARIETFADGFGRYTHPTIRARRFSVDKAVEYFAKAGFTKRGDDGILVNDKGERLSFALSYGKSVLSSAMMSRLKEEAIKAGVEFKLEALDGSAAFARGLEKKHEIMFSGWGVEPPFPVYYEFFNSKNAFKEGSRTPKPMTNNFSVYGDAEMDVLTQANRDAKSEEEVERLCHRIEEIIHRDAPWVPGYKRDKIRCGYWRWVRWPDSFNVKLTRDFHDTHIFWVDDSIKKETRKAMRSGETFPEKNLIFDQYRKKKSGGSESTSSDAQNTEGENGSD